MHSNLVKDVCVCGPVCVCVKETFTLTATWPWKQFLLVSVFFPLFSVHFFLCFYFQPLHSNACSLVRLFHLSRLHTVDTCSPPAHTHTLSSPQHLVPCAPKSVFMILPGSPFHFASLYLSHIALKIEGNWARRWEEEYPCWDSFWTSAKHTRAPTHAQTSSTQISSSFYLILEGLRAGKES